jgi:predicted nucleic acid-binding protein
MKKLILLDAGPLGMVTHPKAQGISLECQRWFQGLLDIGTTCGISEIAAYEVRRELLRVKKTDGLQRLEFLKTIGYYPITTKIMDKAAELWAQARNTGRPASDNSGLDAEMILAAQAACLAVEGWEVIIATTNPKHLDNFADARLWSDVL